MAVMDGESHGSQEKVAFATLLTQASYLPGTLVLIHSLRRHGCRYPIICMVTAKVDARVRAVIERQSSVTLKEVGELYPERQGENGEIAGILQEERFRDTWTKLMVFSCTEFDRIVFLDSDILVRKNLDELGTMQLEQGWIAASHACTCNPFKKKHYPPEWTPENCAFTAMKHPKAMTEPLSPDSASLPTHKLLNSGVLVVRPSREEQVAQKHCLDTEPSIPSMIFPDQDFLALRFRDHWKAIGWQYNGLKTLGQMHGGNDGIWRADQVKVVHYILSPKPWAVDTRERREIGLTERVDTKAVDQTHTSEDELVDWWWDEFYGLRADWNPFPSDKDWQLVLSQMAPVQ